MTTLLAALSRLVRHFPLATMIAALVLTGVLAALATRVQVAVGMEGFAPDNIHIDAADVLGERFGASGEEVLQVLVEAGGGGELISAEGLRAVEEVTAALLASDAAEHLTSNAEQPPVIGPFDPTLQMLERQGLDLATLDDATVRGTFTEGLGQLPGSEAEIVTALLPDDAELAVPSSDAALLLAFISAERLPTDGVDRLEAMIDLQLKLVEAVERASLPAGYEVSAFSFPLLFSDTEAFETEIARLFTTAFLVIVLILATVYWVRPRALLRPLGAGRRTAADVLLTMTTIVMAIIWMNGFAVLLGPGFLEVIGPLTEPTQIVPVLLIGLGVDYAIHLTSRYREEVGQGVPVEEALGRAIRTVGLALGLATVTSALGFLTNLLNPVPTMRDFGILAAVGITAAFVLMLTFVPALRLLLDRRAERAGRLPGPALGHTSRRLLPAAMARTAVLAERGPVATLAVTVALGGALGVWGLSQLETRFSATEFVVPDNPILTALGAVEDRFGGGFGETTEVLVDGDVGRPEVHGALVDALERLREVEWVVMADGQPVAESPLSALAGLVAAGEDGLPASDTVAGVAAAAGLGEDLRFPPGADVAAVYAAAVEAAPEQLGRVVDVDDGQVVRARIGIQTNAGEQDAGELLAALDAAFAPLAAVGIEVVVTSNPVINHTIVLALQEAQVSSLVTTLVAVLVLLSLIFWWRERRPALGVITTAPVVLALLWTFAMMAATGIPFGPLTSTIAALAIGIGVPYAIHVTNRFEEDRRRLPTDEAVRSTVRHTGGALAGSALTTCAGFGVLVTSTLPPFRQFGAVTAYAIFFALLAATLVLPSALSLWDRWHRSRTELARVSLGRQQVPRSPKRSRRPSTVRAADREP
jgi:uncharacterized protein